MSRDRILISAGPYIACRNPVLSFGAVAGLFFGLIGMLQLPVASLAFQVVFTDLLGVALHRSAWCCSSPISLVSLFTDRLGVALHRSAWCRSSPVALVSLSTDLVGVALLRSGWCRSSPIGLCRLLGILIMSCTKPFVAP